MRLREDKKFVRGHHANKCTIQIRNPYFCPFTKAVCGPQSLFLSKILVVTYKKMRSDKINSSLIFAIKILRKRFSVSIVLILSLSVSFRLVLFLKRTKILKKEFNYLEEDHFIIYKNVI